MYGYNDEFMSNNCSTVKLRKLSSNFETDILIIGAGITSLVSTYNLQDLGYDICIVDEADIGGGSTKYNTGIVQYLNDSTLNSMINDDKVNGLKFYNACKDSVSHIKNIITNNNIECDMEVVPCFYCSNNNEDNELIENEYKVLLENDFSSSLYDIDELNKLGIKKDIALKTENTVLINPYKFTMGLYQKLKGSNTFLKGQYLHHKDNIAYFKDDIQIKYKYIILCMGYKTQDYLSYNHTVKGYSYVIVSDEVDAQNYVYIDTKNPYTYIRPYKNRYIIGGVDITKNLKLENDFEANILKLKKDAEDILGIEISIYKKYSALFYTTNNKLPELVSKDNEFYMYAYGGNGIIYADIISNVVKNLIGGKL